MSAVAPAAPPRVAVVDLGSNSLHLLIAALPPGQAPALLAVHCAQAELGRHINGRIDPAREALTQATFLGVFTRAGQPGERLLVIDMGGRSTELILGEDGGILADLSLPLGHLRESSLSPEDEVRAALSAADAARFSAAQVDRVVVTAGTALTLTHMAALARGEHGEERHGRAATFEELAAVAERLNTLPLEARRALPGYDLRRERSLSRGAFTLVALWRALGVGRVVAGEAGLREGLIAARRR